MRIVIFFLTVLVFAHAGADMALPLKEQQCEEFNKGKKYINDYALSEIAQEAIDLINAGEIKNLLRKNKDNNKTAYAMCVYMTDFYGPKGYKDFKNEYLPKLLTGAILKDISSPIVANKRYTLLYNKAATVFDNYILAIRVEKPGRLLHFSTDYISDGEIMNEEFELQMGGSHKIGHKRKIYQIALTDHNKSSYTITIDKLK